nr:hypothetical protein [Tanacetum cinerariifolium]
MECGFVSYSMMILEKSSRHEEIHEVDNHEKLVFLVILKHQRMNRDGASWSIAVEEGKLVNAAGFGATNSAIRAITLGAGGSTL